MEAAEKQLFYLVASPGVELIRFAQAVTSDRRVDDIDQDAL